MKGSTEKTYTLGEILRLGLLKGHDGKPYRHRATIFNVVRRHLKYQRVPTKHGAGYAVPKSEIERFNNTHQ